MTKQTTETTVYSGGVPTEPDVIDLLDTFTNMTEGFVVMHSDIEGVLSVPRRSNRYRTVVDAWRKRLESERDIVMGAYRSQDPDQRGYVVLTDAERLNAGHAKLGVAERATVRGVVLAAKAKPANLTAEDRTRRDWIVRSGTAIAGHMRTSARRLDAAMRKALGA